MNPTQRKHPLLGVNIDHVATLRQARGTTYPSIPKAAQLTIDGGADQITIHLREDRRHIQDQDVYDLKKMLTVPLNLEMATEEDIVNVACDVTPATVTLVPEKREELTTEGGLDCIAHQKRLGEVIRRMHDAGISVSLFIDPVSKQLEMSKELLADAIELHTGAYCDAPDLTVQNEELAKLKEAAKRAKDLGFKVCAGHGLNLDNITEVVESIPEIVEYNIGHAIIARAVAIGLKMATKEMLDRIRP